LNEEKYYSVRCRGYSGPVFLELPGFSKQRTSTRSSRSRRAISNPSLVSYMVFKLRLKTMYETYDGFEIARRDLELRGPGEFLGVRQSGLALLRFADLNEDIEIAEQAHALAAQLLTDCPDVVDAHLERWMRGREDYLKA